MPCQILISRWRNGKNKRRSRREDICRRCSSEGSNLLTRSGRCVVLGWEERGKQRKAYRRYVAEGVTQGSRRGRIPRVRSEKEERLVKEVGMSLEGPARLMGVSTSAISGILQDNNQKKHGVIQLPPESRNECPKYKKRLMNDLSTAST